MKAWAIIKTGGKQYKVVEASTISVDKLPHEVNKSIVFDEVLAVFKDGRIKLGQPFIKNTKVNAKIVDTYKDKKIRVVKFKSKSRYLKTQGHRQPKTKVLIEKILA